MLSFVVPAHNEGLELPETLRSIRRAAVNAGQPFEIIVVDDSSTDRTTQIAGGLWRACGVRFAAGTSRPHGMLAHVVHPVKFCSFVDADTRINAAHVEGAIAALAEGACGGSAQLRFDRAVPFWAHVCFKIFCAIISRRISGRALFSLRAETIFSRRADSTNNFLPRKKLI